MKVFASLTLLLFALTGCRQENKPVKTYQPVFNFLATGDPAAGRQAFSHLKCDTCHRVAGSVEFQSTILSGPDLGALEGGYSASAIADAIVAPSHGTSSKAATGGPISSMGDYSNVMTVRQLTDLVAFVRQLPD